MRKIKKAIIILVSILILTLIIIIAVKRNIDIYPKEITADTPNELIEIERNDYNNYDYKPIDEKQKVTFLYNDFKELILYSSKNAYNKINKEYREKRFENEEEFYAYVNKNAVQIKQSNIYAYKVLNYKEYTQYLIADQFGNYYVFNETSPMNYEVMLDNYSVDLPNFIEEYEASNEKNKVSLNIQKIVQAHNMENYKYIYSYLDDNFKSNNYPTLEDFESFINDNLYNRIKLKLNTYVNEGEINIYNITLTDKENNENPGINMQIIMKLKEDREFVMSFSIQ